MQKNPKVNKIFNQENPDKFGSLNLFIKTDNFYFYFQTYDLVKLKLEYKEI